MERGRALIQESIAFGVTHMRAFVEVDPCVQFKCLDAGLALKQEFRNSLLYSNMRIRTRPHFLPE